MHAPSIATNRNGTPTLVGKIKIEPAGMLSDAGMDYLLRRSRAGTCVCARHHRSNGNGNNDWRMLTILGLHCPRFDFVESCPAAAGRCADPDRLGQARSGVAPMDGRTLRSRGAHWRSLGMGSAIATNVASARP